MRHFLFFTAALLFLVVSGCHKKAFDHRNKYTGDYKFYSVVEYWQINQNYVTYDTIYHTGHISYSYGDDKDVMHIYFTEGAPLDVLVKENGFVYFSCGATVGTLSGDNHHRHLSLSFSSNECGNNGMGAGANYTITADEQ